MSRFVRMWNCIFFLSLSSDSLIDTFFWNFAIFSVGIVQFSLGIWQEIDETFLIPLTKYPALERRSRKSVKKITRQKPYKFKICFVNPTHSHERLPILHKWKHSYHMRRLQQLSRSAYLACDSKTIFLLKNNSWRLEFPVVWCIDSVAAANEHRWILSSPPMSCRERFTKVHLTIFTDNILTTVHFQYCTFCIMLSH